MGFTPTLAIKELLVRPSRIAAVLASAIALVLIVSFPTTAHAAPKPHIFQRPSLSHDLIAFGYAGDLWTVPREGGRATRLTIGVGIETAPVFSPDGNTIAFTADYDGNTDVFTIPATGGIPYRVTYHPTNDFAVGWTPDGKQIIFRSNRQAASRYTQLFTVPAQGGVATPLPLPMAYQGQLSADGSHIAYSPLPSAFGFDYTSFVSWGNYRGGRAGTLWVTSLPRLDSVMIPHEAASDFSPVYAGKEIFFLSGRKGPIGIFRYDPGSGAVTEALHNSGPDIRTLSSDGSTLVYDQLGEIYLYDIASGKSHLVPIGVDADLPEVRPRIKNVADEIDHASISPTGLRAAFEAHGEVLTVPAKHGPTRNITATPGVMERSPAWSPDGQSIAYFSDESDLYALHVSSQTGAAQAGAPAVKKFPLAPEAAYYFDPLWSPDSKRIAFHDNRLNIYVLDTTTGKLSTVGDKNVYGGFSNSIYDLAWSPDSKWIAYPHSMPNHLHAIFLYSVETGQSTQVSSEMGDSALPSFDPDGKYLYFTASTNAGATSDSLDMTSDLYSVTSYIYSVVLSAGEASPVAPELDDEKATTEAKASDGEKKDEAQNEGKNATEAKSSDAEEKDEGKNAGKDGNDKVKPGVKAPTKPVKIDLAGIQTRIIALPLPGDVYSSLAAGLKGSVYFLTLPRSGWFGEQSATLSRWTLKDRKTEKLAEHVEQFKLSANGEKMLLALSNRKPDDPPDDDPPPTWVIVASDVPVKPGEGILSLADMQVRVDPPAEWAQMYHEVWRIERAYFYDPHFHGADTVGDERRFEPYVTSIASRADLNYIFQEMLSAFSVGHLRGNGGAIPLAPHVAGGLLGADYVVRNNRYCLAKIYNGGAFNSQDKAPLAQPGLSLAEGDCILAINGQDLTASVDIQKPLEGTAEHIISLRVVSADGGEPREISVRPIASEARLRNIDWIEANQRKVDQLSGGKLGYVYLPDTGEDGFTNFNRYYFAQTQKQGAIIDERFNGGGQVADYFIEVMNRRVESYWAPRYGAIERTPNAAIYGPKVMIANEVSGSGGDALPWLFKQAKLGTLVGKRTWGGLVGIGPIPVLMDGGHVTSPSVAFFSPKGEWDVENHGVDPDVVVEQDPKAVSEGHDPQLETAVSIALKDLAQNPTTHPERPAYPNYHR
jgi:tricorn protease